jgi:hypothetical protein
MATAGEIVVQITIRKLPIIGQSMLGYRCLTTTGKSGLKAATSTSLFKRWIYGAGAACSGTAGLISVANPNVSIPLMAVGEACLHLAVSLDKTGDNLSFFP